MLLTLTVCVIHEEYMNLNFSNLEKESVIFGQLSSPIEQELTWEADVRAGSNISCPLWHLKVTVPWFYQPATEPSHASYLIYSDSDWFDCADDVTLAVYTKLKVQKTNVQEVLISEVSLSSLQDNMLVTVFIDFFQEFWKMYKMTLTLVMTWEVSCRQHLCW
jgi:hypothetical protein